MIRSAIPFGGLIIVIFLIGTFFLGVILSIGGWARGSRPMSLIGLALVCGATFVFVFDSVLDSLVEWNPRIANDSETVGTWGDGRTSVTLAPDGTFVYRRPEGEIKGTWKRDDWNLQLSGITDSHEMRFIQVAGSYRLMTKPPDDPDMWDGDLGLPRKQ